jgi:hypothetical protein
MSQIFADGEEDGSAVFPKTSSICANLRSSVDKVNSVLVR